MKLLAGMKCHPLLPLLLSAGVWARPSPVSSPEADADNIYNINCAQFSGGNCVNYGTSISGDTTNNWGGPADCWSGTPMAARMTASPLAVCASGSSGGAWIVIQRRLQGGNSQTYFAQDFTDYQAGFTQNGELWLGLETLTELTSRGGFELKVELTSWAGEKHYAYYSDFKVGPGPDYQLTVGGFDAARSNLGDSLNFHNGGKFSTKDKDQDTNSGASCSNGYGNGGWWFKACSHSNLNGHNYPAEESDNYKGLYWYLGGTARGDGRMTHKETQMAVRKLGN